MPTELLCIIQKDKNQFNGKNGLNRKTIKELYMTNTYFKKSTQQITKKNASEIKNENQTGLKNTSYLIMVWRIKPSYLLLAGIHTGMYLGPSLVAQQSRIHLQCRRYMFNPWVFSSTTIQKHQFFGTQPSLQL